MTECKERLYHFLVYRETLVVGPLLIIISSTQHLKHVLFYMRVKRALLH